MWSKAKVANILEWFVVERNTMKLGVRWGIVDHIVEYIVGPSPPPDSDHWLLIWFCARQLHYPGKRNSVCCWQFT